MIFVRSAKVDDLQIGTWKIEREGDCTYLDGGKSLWSAARLAVDAGMKALSKTPQTLLAAVRESLDEEVNKLLEEYVEKTNELIRSFWPTLAGAEPSKKRAREVDASPKTTAKKPKN